MVLTRFGDRLATIFVYKYVIHVAITLEKPPTVLSFNKTKPMIKYLSLLAIALLWAGQLHAGVIPGVTVNSFSSQFATARFATNLVSNAGLFGHHHSVDVRTLWLTVSSTSSNLANAFVTFDLGSVRTIDKMKVWNYNEVISGANILTRRGVKTANISVAGEDKSSLPT